MNMICGIINTVEDSGRFHLSKYISSSERLGSSTNTRQTGGLIYFNGVRMASGIYEIVNMVNGHRYIGSAKNFETRWKLHRNKLNKGNHESGHLQNAWNKYGEDAFEFHVLAYTSIPYLLYTEQIFLDEENPEYNICTIAGSSLGLKRSIETKLKQSELKKGKQPWLGLKHTEESKQKMSQSRFNYYNRERQAGKKIISGMKGHKQTEKAKQKMRNSRIGKPHGGKVQIGTVVSPEGEIFIDIFDLSWFCKERNLDPSHLRNVITGKAKSHKGWKRV